MRPQAAKSQSTRLTVLQGALLVGFLMLIFSNIAAAATPRWVASTSAMPVDAVRSDAANGSLYVCRGRFNGEVVPGTLVGGACRVPYRGREYVISDFQILAGDIAWGRSGSTGILAGEIGGRPLRVCRAAYRNTVYFGKLDGNDCTIAYDGREVLLTNFDVLQARYPLAVAEPPAMAQSIPVTSHDWAWCAAENGDCRFEGVRDVRYGDGHRFVVRRFESGVRCDDATFGDPAPASVKHCEVGPMAAAGQAVVVAPPAVVAAAPSPQGSADRFATDLHNNLGLVVRTLSREREPFYLQRADERRFLLIDDARRLWAPRDAAPCAVESNRTDCRWVLVPAPERDGSYFIRNAAYPVFLRVAGAPLPGSEVIAGGCERGAEAACLWTVEASLTRPDAVYLRSRAAPLYLQLDPGRGDRAVAHLAACPRQVDDRNCQFEFGVAADSARYAGYRPGSARLVSGTRDLLELAIDRRVVPLAAVANTSGEFTDLRR